MPSTQHEIKGKIEWAKVFEVNRDRADFHTETDGMYKVTVVTDEATMKSMKKEGLGKTFKETDGGWAVTLDRPHKGRYDWQGGQPVVADITGKTWNLEDKGFIGNGSEGIVKFELYDAGARKGSRLLGLQVLNHVVYEAEGGSSQPPMFTDHSSSAGASTPTQEPEDSIPF